MRIRKSNHRENVATPNDPKLSDGGGLAQPVHGGGKAAAEAPAVTDRSRSLQRMVRPIEKMCATYAIRIAENLLSNLGDPIHWMRLLCRIIACLEAIGKIPEWQSPEGEAVLNVELREARVVIRENSESFLDGVAAASIPHLEQVVLQKHRSGLAPVQNSDSARRDSHV